jgi:hypothetical protein
MTTNHTTAPELNEGFIAINPETTTKRTEKEETFFIVKEEFVFDPVYNTIMKAGAIITNPYTTRTIAGLVVYNGYANVTIPWTKLEEKTVITVREYVTTRYEIVEK